MTTNSPPGTIITFYSYKGGTGRSMALANVAWILAAAGKSVLVLDWDLEAPGLHRYFRPFLIDKELTASDGIIDFLITYADAAVSMPPKGSAPAPQEWYVEHADITDYALSLNFGEFPPGGRIDFVPAGRQGTTYATRVNTFDWQKFYTRLGGGAFLEAAKVFMREYDYVLIDSRTGVSDTSGICTVQMPDVLVVCFTYNNQSIEGAAAVAQSAQKEHAEFRRKIKADGDGTAPAPAAPGGDDKFRILSIPMRAELNEKIKLERRKKIAKRRFNQFLAHIPATEREAYWGAVEVPYIPFYAFEELLAPFIDSPSDLSSVLAAMVRITDYLTGSAVKGFDLDISTAKKEEVLREFALAPDEDLKPAAPPPGRMDEALKKQIALADETYSHLTKEEEETARRLWTRLVRVPRADERGTNSGVALDLNDLDKMSRHLARQLAEVKLLVIEKDEKTGGLTVKVANEELLRNWPTLLKWIDGDRDFLLWRQQLKANVAEWYNNRRAKSNLLGGRRAYEAYKNVRRRPDDFTDDEVLYVEKSVFRQRLADALTYVVIAGVVAGLAALGYYGWSVKQAEAETAERLGRAVQNFNSEDPQADLELGVLLAVESWSASGDKNAEGFLRNNLERLPRVVANLRHEADVDSVTFNSRGTLLTTVSGKFVASQDRKADESPKTARVWELPGREIARLSLDPAAQNFAVSSGGRFVAVAGTERAEDPSEYGALVYDLHEPGGGPLKANVHQDAINDMTFSPERGAGVPGEPPMLATASEDGTVKVFDVMDKRLLTVRPLAHASPVFFLAFGSQRHLVTGSEDNSITSWGLMSPGGGDGSVRLESSILMVASSPDDRYCAAIVLRSPRAREPRLLTTPRRGKPPSVMRLPASGDVSDVTFSPDSRYVAAAGESGRGEILSVADARSMISVTHGAAIYKMVFSGDGKYVATIGQNNLARIWEVTTGREFQRLTLGGQVNDLAFSPDGRYVAAASADGLARVWDVSSPGPETALKEEACGRLSRNFTQQEWSRYFGGQSYRKTCAELP